MHIFKNSKRLPDLPDDISFPSTNADAPRRLLEACPAAGTTPLVNSATLANAVGVSDVHVKDERDRMGLGSFKALGAAYVIAHLARESGAADLATALNGQTFATASAGNHGMSVAAGARVFGARSIIFIADTVPESFAVRLREKGAEVRRVGADYEQSMSAAMRTAKAEGWTLLSDSSWPGYVDLPHRLMEGYLVMAAEAAEQIDQPPTHIFLQAGVGGLAGAVAAFARDRWGPTPTIIVVEPKFAPALIESVKAGRVVDTSGPDSSMGRLDCKTPSLIALKGLARDADFFVTISEGEAGDALPTLDNARLATSPSGGAGLAALLSASEDQRQELGLTSASRVLAFLSEGPVA